MHSLTDKVERVLIYRSGGLSETVVALPCLHIIEHRFPQAERRLLTSAPLDRKVPSPPLVLGDSGLIHSYSSSALGSCDFARLRRTSAAIRQWKPDVLVYLVQPHGFTDVVRDACFFYASGVRKIIGIPWRKRDRLSRWITRGGYYEPEAERLVRCLNMFDAVQLGNSALWSLRLGEITHVRAESLLRHWTGKAAFIVCALGAKLQVEHWGAKKWKTLLGMLGKRYRESGLLLVGSAEESVSSTDIAENWRGPVLNLCGMTSPRETAALMQRATLFLGHGSGPMHLAAAVGTRCVAVLSARDLPRVWFPYGQGHRPIYHQTSCAGCGFDNCGRFNKMCINSITVDEVYAAANHALNNVYETPKSVIL
jgi:heptosyltransferase III